MSLLRSVGFRSRRSVLGITASIRLASNLGHIIPGVLDAKSSPELENIPESFTQHATPLSTEAAELASQQIHDLHSLGLGLGWGPTSLLQNFVDYTHAFTGLPWWGTIIASSVLVRLALFPINLKVASTITKMALFQPKVQMLMGKMRKAQMEGDKLESVKTNLEVKKIYDEAGVGRFDSLWGLAQIPVFVCFYRALMGMAQLPVPGLTHGGAAWFVDLTAADPYLALGALSAGITFTTFRLGSENGSAVMSPTMQKFMYIVPLIIVPVSAYLPAAVVLYFTTNSAFGFLQGALFRSPRGRQLVGLPPMPTKEQLAAAGAQSQMGFKENFDAMMKSFRDQQAIARTRAQEKQLDKDYQARLKKRISSSVVRSSSTIQSSKTPR